jgi:hypothetical protein
MVLATAAFVAGTLPVRAQGYGPAGGADEIRVEDRKEVFALFSDISGCVQTDAVLTASIEESRVAPETPTGTVQVSAIVSSFDVCSGSIIRQVDGVTTRPSDVSLAVAENLESATLNATLDARDIFTGDSTTLNVSLIWTATGPPTAVTSSGTDRSVPGSLVITTLRQMTRLATATGVISDGTRNYAPAPSALAQIDEVRQHAFLVRTP